MGFVYNVMDFGATGDGSTDDRQAIQDALDKARDSLLVPGIPQINSNASNNGAIVFFPCGTYIIGNGTSCGPNVDCVLNVYSNTTLMGVGTGSVIQSHDDAFSSGSELGTLNLVRNPSSTLLADPPSNIRITRLKIHNNGDGKNIIINGGKNIIIDNCEISQDANLINSSCVRITHYLFQGIVIVSENILIRKNRFFPSRKAVITQASSNPLSTTQNVVLAENFISGEYNIEPTFGAIKIDVRTESALVSNNIIHGHGRFNDGINVQEDVTYSIVDGNEVVDVRRSGIKIEAAQDSYPVSFCGFTNNLISRVTNCDLNSGFVAAHGISINSGGDLFTEYFGDLVIGGNVISQCKDFGIQHQGANLFRELLVSNNSISECFQGGVGIIAIEGLSLLGNDVRKVHGYGLHVESSSPSRATLEAKDTLIVDNMLDRIEMNNDSIAVGIGLQRKQFPVFEGVTIHGNVIGKCYDSAICEFGNSQIPVDYLLVNGNVLRPDLASYSYNPILVFRDRNPMIIANIINSPIDVDSSFQAAFIEFRNGTIQPLVSTNMFANAQSLGGSVEFNGNEMGLIRNNLGYKSEGSFQFTLDISGYSTPTCLPIVVNHDLGRVFELSDCQVSVWNEEGVLDWGFNSLHLTSITPTQIHGAFFLQRVSSAPSADIKILVRVMTGGYK